jgi:hypothetical protein
MYRIETNGIVVPSQKGDELMSIKDGKRYPIYRSGFLTDTTSISGTADKPTNHRVGMGNRRIFRSGFERAEIAPRNPLSFETLQLADMTNPVPSDHMGTRVQETFTKQFSITVKDPSDKTYKAENRPQRYMTKRVSLGAIGLSLEDKLETIIKAQKETTEEYKKFIVVEIAKLVRQMEDLAEASDTQTKTIGKIASTTSKYLQEGIKNSINKLDLPVNPTGAGLPTTIVLYEQLQNNTMVMIYLLSRLPNYTIPAFPGMRQKSYDLMRLRQTMRNRPSELFINLDTLQVIPFAQAARLAGNGTDNGMLNGIPSPAGGWTNISQLKMSPPLPLLPQSP